MLSNPLKSYYNINEFHKVAGYKATYTKIICVFYTSNELFKTEIRKQFHLKHNEIFKSKCKKRSKNCVL